MDDLVGWLRKQLDERERMARRIADAEYFHGVSSDAEAEVLALADPDWVLAEVDAKRRVLDAFTTAQASEESEYDGGYTTGLLTSLRLLALPYADRPGYRDEWRASAA